MSHDLQNPIREALRRLSRDELEDLAVRAALNNTHRVVAGAIPETLKVMRAAGYSDEEIRVEIADACAELGFNCGGG
jgi:hypothetical protein